MEKTNKTKIWSFEKICKIHKALARDWLREKEKTEIAKISNYRNKSGDITTNFTETKSIR